MEMHALSDISVQEPTGNVDIRLPIQRRARRQPGTEVPQSTTLRSAVRLLGEAAKVLADNKEDARRYIVRAAALLQAEADLQGHDVSSTSESRRRQLAPWQVARVLRFIDTNLGDKIGPDHFAGLARLSTSHFARAFRATVGEAPYAYLIRRRVERAKEIMLETDLPLAQIALDCGLSDQAHMTRLFTRMVGVSPGAWRRAHVAAPRAAHGSVDEPRPLTYLS